ncbi:MFS transporter [Meiothermus sp. PNK-Is4]|uniref:MFS transporter n=1 Tax=Meiothermus sp. PNK-Is4 TaxID=2740565 RepID=UPI00101F91BD|nr:MFS transporter [Meiothermus sp. PNK-Is4]RYM39503.1 MFS transporter [Meiothermus sp. PNK-Is4]
MRLRLTLGSVLSLFLSGIIAASPGGLLPQWQEAFEVGSRLSLYFNLYLAGLLAGLTLSRLTPARHPWFSLAMALAGLGLLGVASARSFETILWAAFPLGLGVGAINLNGNSLPGELYPERRMVVLSQVNAAFGLGAIATPFLVSLFPWREVLVVFALTALAGALLVWRAPAGQVVRVANGHGVAGWMWLLALATAMYAGLEQGFATFSGAYFKELGYPTALAGALLSLYWVAFTVGHLLLSYWVARDPLRHLTWLVCGAAGVALLYFLPPLPLLFPLAGLLIGPIFTTLMTLGQERMGVSAVAYALYAGAGGSTLIPALLALLPVTGVPWGLLGASLALLTLTHSLRRLDARLAL